MHTGTLLPHNLGTHNTHKTHTRSAVDNMADKTGMTSFILHINDKRRTRGGAHLRSYQSSRLLTRNLQYMVL